MYIYQVNSFFLWTITLTNPMKTWSGRAKMTVSVKDGGQILDAKPLYRMLLPTSSSKSLRR
jgi:hypothetical protein